MTNVLRIAIGVSTLALAVAPQAAAKLSDLPSGAPAQKAAIKCLRTIQKETSKYAAAHMKLVVQCKSAVLKGTSPSLAACAPLSGDLATADASRAQRLTDKIARACGGSDRICGAGTGTAADVPLADINWDVGSCPLFGDQGTGNAINDCGDIPDCLIPSVKLANHQVANEIGADLFDETLFGTGGDSNKCQRSSFRALTKFYLVKSKALLKCWTAKTKRKSDDFDDADPCPDTDVAKRKTKTSIEKASLKLAKTLCKACGGSGDSDKDGGCDTPSTPLDFVAAPFLCPNVLVPGSNGPGGVVHFFDNDTDPTNAVHCLAMGDPLIDTVQEYVNCLGCVAEYDADCVSLMPNGSDTALGMIYPIECASEPECGNGVLDAGEACDPFAVPSICPNAGNGLQTCNLDCTCLCPGTMTFSSDANDPASVLDAGWGGWAHGSRLLGGPTMTVALSGGSEGTPGLRDPTCGVMDITGPIQNTAAGAGQIEATRCSMNTDVPCMTDADCLPSESCTTFLGPPFPLSAAGLPFCIRSRVTEAIVGTLEVETGTMASNVGFGAELVVGQAIDKPCNNCIGDLVANDGARDGTCDTGARFGMGCDVQGVSPIPTFNGSPVDGPNALCSSAGTPLPCCTGPATGTCLNGTSLDCPHAPAGSNVGVLAIDLSTSTGTEALTVQASGPGCTAGGFAGSTCMCDTCATEAAEPCNADSDCPAAITCGGLRCLGGGSGGAPCTGLPTAIDDPACHAHCTGPGTPDACCTGPGVGAGCACGRRGERTKPNQCTGGTCAGGTCPATFNGFCSPTQTYRGCLAPSDCSFPGDTCTFVNQPCFDGNGIVGGIISASGSPDPPVNDRFRPTLASTFCMGTSSSSLVNGALSLPGPSRLTVRGYATLLP